MDFLELSDSANFLQQADAERLTKILHDASAEEKMGKLTLGLERMRQALKDFPNSYELYFNISEFFKRQGRVREALLVADRAMKACPQSDVMANSRLFLLHYLEDWTAERIFIEIKDYSKKYLAQTPMVPAHLLKPLRGPRKIRVGFASPDFRGHSVGFFALPILSGIDTNRFEIYGYYSTKEAQDHMTKRIRERCQHWREFAPRDYETCSKAMLEDRLDILIDFAGHSHNNFLPILAARMAPIQATMLGYPNTTGTPNVDYRIVDDLSDPEGMTDAYNTEKLLRMEGCAWCFGPDTVVPHTDYPPFIYTNSITFGCFNFLPKISDHSIKLWKQILEQVPNSTLLIKSIALCDEGSIKSLLTRFARVDFPLDRIRTNGFVGKENHFRFYNEIDIALDPYPYHGTTTTCEALWMGVPVISQAGTTHVSRVGASLLSQAGAPELVAESEDDYVAKAVALAQDRKRLIHYRQNMRDTMLRNPLCDPQQYGVHFCEALEKMLREKNHPLARI